MTCYFDLQQKKNDAKNDQCQSCIVDGQELHRIKGEDECNKANNTRQYGAGVVQFKQYSIQAQQHENVADVWVTKDIQYFLRKTHFVQNYPGVFCMQRHGCCIKLNLSSIELVQQILFIDGNEIDDFF